MRVPASSEPVQHELCQPCWQEEGRGEVAPLAVVVAGLGPAPPQWLCLVSPGSLSAKLYFCENDSLVITSQILYPPANKGLWSNLMLGSM